MRESGAIDSIELLSIQLSQMAGGETSQHGENGVIDAVFGAIGVRSRTCVEFGAYDLEAYSNIYPLWTAGWRALLIEGDLVRHAKLCADYRAHPQHADTRVEIENRFVAESGPDSLDHILEEHGFPTDVDLVSIDIDGRELQVWRGLQRFRPRQVIVEYNPTIPTHLERVGGDNDLGCRIAATGRGRRGRLQ